MCSVVAVAGLAVTSGCGAGEISGTGACGNGTLDPGESCDTGIAQAQPGGCATGCDDQDPWGSGSEGGADRKRNGAAYKIQLG